MLDKVIGTIGSLFIILLFVICGAVFVSLIGQWYLIQNEAQFLAQSQGKYGGYTQEANTQLASFISEHNIERSRINVQVSSPGRSTPWGTPVKATINYNFPFRVGNWINFNVPLKGVGESVSTYLPGAYSVTYTNPRW